MRKDKTGVKIYSAIPNDGKGLVRVSRITWLATYPNKKLGITVKDLGQRKEFEKQRIERWRKNIKENKNRKTWVAKTGREIVGFCGASKEDNVHEIGAIYVLPKYQGKGIGKELIKKAFDWLGDRKDILVRVVSYNTPSIKFYESVGFQKVGIVKKSEWHKLPSGKLLPEIEMKKISLR
ncbi:MAG: GNAT family N-acetyltransferase [Candidatus Magasanikbacteria bacterium]